MPKYEYTQGTLKDAQLLGQEGWQIICSVDHPRGTQFVLGRLVQEAPPAEIAPDERKGAVLAKPAQAPASGPGKKPKGKG